MILSTDLLIAQKLVYEPSKLILEQAIKEKESQEYGACKFIINNKHVRFRIAKITPKKTGQFVTIWKRSENGTIVPFDMGDQIDFIVVSVRFDKNFGQFIFAKEVLYEKGFLSKNGKGGKRAMRIYPPWDIVSSSIAKETQNWQLNYFIEIDAAIPTDVGKIKKLFS